MQSRRFAVAVVALAALAALPANPLWAVTYEVGVGRPYQTIQSAIDAAANAEGQPDHTPNPTILIHGGVYNELVEIPFDPDFSTNGAGVNDGWTIRAAPNESVVLRGHMLFFFGRENFLIEGLVIDNSNSGNPSLYAGINFHGGTTRGNTVRNCVVYGVNNDGTFGNPAVRGNLTYGANTLDHVTLFDVDYGITANTNAFFDVKNSIVTESNHYGIFSTPGSASTVSSSNFFNNAPNYEGNIVNGGNNVGHPVGVDPMFVSTDPANPYFLWLRPDSPMVGAGEAGSNLGGRPVFEPIWNGGSGSNWTTGANWVAGFIPNAINMTAKLGSTALSRNLAVDAPITLGKLTIDSAASYSVSGPQTLTLQSSNGNATLSVLQGSHTISAPLALGSNATIDVSPASSVLTLSDLQTTTMNQNKTGAGRLNVNRVRANALAINGGAVRIIAGGTDASTSSVQSLSIVAGASLDLTNNAMVINYTGASPLAARIVDIAAGRLTTSDTTAGVAIGYAEAAALNLATFAGQNVDATSVLLRATLRGDTNLDRVVDFTDLLKLAQNYNRTNKVWTDGDSTLDGTVGFDDLLNLAQGYGRAFLDSGTILTDPRADFASDWALARALVPEPVSLLAFTALLAFRRRPPNPCDG